MSSNLDNRVKQLECAGDGGPEDIHVYMRGYTPGMVLDCKTGKQITQAEYERRTAGERVIKITRDSVMNNGY